MKTKKPMRFLSNRILALAAVQLFAIALMIAAALLAGDGMNGAWPVILSASLGVEAAVILLACFWVVRPYRRYAKQVALFSEGYTLALSEDDKGVELCPVSQQLAQRRRLEFNATHLLKLSKRQAQFRALQNQINPHFLYNTLESIRSEALVAGLDSVADMTEALAVFFRYTISKVENLVTIEEELQNCVTYFHIQQYRFGERLQFQIDCDEEDKKEIFRCRIPKLTLQPILENSIIHGTEMKLGAGRLIVKLERTESLLMITVSDDGAGMDEDTLAKLNEGLDKSGRAFQENREEKGGVALVNVNNRIHLLFGEEYGLHVFSIMGEGTDVQITLPAITSDREVMGREVVA